MKRPATEADIGTKLVELLPAWMVLLLQSFGVCDVLSFGNKWDSTHECRMAVSSEMLSSEQEDSLCAAWTEADTACDARANTKGARQCPMDSSKRVSDGTLLSTPMTVGPPLPWAGKSEGTAVKREVGLLVEALLHAKEHSSLLQGLSSSLVIETVVLLAESWETISLGTLRSARSTLNRFKLFALDRESDWRCPAQATLAIFVKLGRAHGPTASKSRLSGLSWIARNFELPWRIDAELVKNQSKVSADHEEHQAVLLAPRVWHCLELASCSSNDVVHVVSMVWLLLILGCVRFAHAQRSCVSNWCEDFVEFLAAKGKSKDRGHRRPFRWQAPLTAITGVDLSSALVRFLEVTRNGPTRPFLMPDTHPRTRKIASIVGFVNRPMAAAKFIAITRSMLAAKPFCMDMSSSKCVTTYSARRVLPSIADMARVSTEDALAVGGWSDPSLAAASSRRSMPQLYAAMRTVTSMKVKRKLVKCTAERLQGYSLIKEDPTWESLARDWPNLVNAAAGDTKAETDSEDVSATSEGSSSSADEEIVDPDDSTFAWLTSVGKHGRVHLCGGECDGFTTACGRTLKRPNMGFSVRDSLSTGVPWSPRCFGKLPKAARDMILHAPA